MAATGTAFESLVSFEGSETRIFWKTRLKQFESLVSFEGSETSRNMVMSQIWFESLVSFEGSETFLQGKVG